MSVPCSARALVVRSVAVTCVVAVLAPTWRHLVARWRRRPSRAQAAIVAFVLIAATSSCSSSRTATFVPTNTAVPASPTLLDGDLRVVQATVLHVRRLFGGTDVTELAMVAQQAHDDLAKER